MTEPRRGLPGDDAPRNTSKAECSLQKLGSDDRMRGDWWAVLSWLGWRAFAHADLSVGLAALFVPCVQERTPTASKLLKFIVDAEAKSIGMS
jgi:hypothetical protein